MSQGLEEGDEEMIRISLEIWHPNCWTIKITKKTDAGLLGHGVYTGAEDTAKGRFTVYGDSTDDVETLIEATRKSELTGSVMEIRQSWETDPAQVHPSGNTNREIFVEFNPENSIDEAFISRGFVYDGPTRIESGKEHWTLVAHHDREKVKDLLDDIREEMDADITVRGISSKETIHQQSKPKISKLSARQREIFEYTRDQGYYEWPRDVTARELASQLNISKTTFLEHLRKAESKLLNSLS